jgi:hypothetical protein
MAHLIEEYAKSLGVKIGKPVIVDHFYPTLHDKYITIHCDNKIDSKYYEYFPQVLNLIKQILNDNGYAIYQVGGSQDPHLQVDGIFLNLTYRQSCYLIKNSKLHIGIDSLPVHLASMYDIPIIALYSHIYSNHAKPYWSSKEKVIILEADRKGNKPSFNYREEPKTIRTINPEQVANAALNLLEINTKINFFTKKIGSHFHLEIMEVIPDFKANLSDKNKSIYIRADLDFNEENIFFWASEYKNSIMSNKQIDLELIKACAQNINHIYFKTIDLDIEYLENLKKLKINFTICHDEEQTIAQVKNKFFDFRVEYDSWKEKIKSIEKIDCNFLTNKILISKGKVYPSEAHYKNNKELDSPNKVIYDDDTFWKEVDHFLFYETRI